MARRDQRRSAGVLLYRSGRSGVEVLLAHPGGPLWERKDDGAWTIPKGLTEPGEDDWTTARREFAEEMGSELPDAAHLDLGEVRLKSGKVVVAFAVEGDLDAATVVSNLFEMQWPPRSGQMRSFPEVDRAEWFTPAAARIKLNPAQVPLIDRLCLHLSRSL